MVATSVFLRRTVAQWFTGRDQEINLGISFVGMADDFCPSFIYFINLFIYLFHFLFISFF